MLSMQRLCFPGLHFSQSDGLHFLDQINRIMDSSFQDLDESRLDIISEIFFIGENIEL